MKNCGCNSSMFQTLPMYACMHCTRCHSLLCPQADVNKFCMPPAWPHAAILQKFVGIAALTQVQLDIRTGHQQTVDKVLKWLDQDGGVKDTSICDAGCGTGSLSLPLALRVSCCQASLCSCCLTSSQYLRGRRECCAYPAVSLRHL